MFLDLSHRNFKIFINNTNVSIILVKNYSFEKSNLHGTPLFINRHENKIFNKDKFYIFFIVGLKLDKARKK